MDVKGILIRCCSDWLRYVYHIDNHPPLDSAPLQIAKPCCSALLSLVVVRHHTQNEEVINGFLRDSISRAASASGCCFLCAQWEISLIILFKNIYFAINRI